MSERIKLTEKDLDVVETVDGNAFLETPIQYTIQECKDLKAQILSALKMQEIVKERMNDMRFSKGNLYQLLESLTEESEK